MLLEFFLFIVLFVIFLIYTSRDINVWKRQGIKGPLTLPFFGNSYDNIFKDLHVIETERYEKYGPIYGYLDYMRPFLTVGVPELIKQITITDFNLFRNHIPLLPGDPIFSKGLGFTDDDTGDWKRMRTILNPGFNKAKVKQMCPMMIECVDNTLKHLQRIADSKSEFVLLDVCSANSIDIITRCAFGIKTNAHENPNDAVLVNSMKLIEFPRWRAISGRFLPNRLQKLFGAQLLPESTLNFFGDLFDHVAIERQGNEDKYNDFLQIMLNAREKPSKSGSVEGNGVNKSSKTISYIEMLAQIPEFLVGGYEPTAALLVYALYSLAVYPDTQDKLYNELICKLGDDEITYDKVNELHYLEAVVNECLRLYGPFVNSDRVSSTDYKLGDTGIIIPKGAVVNIPLFAIHHDPKYHPEPYTFKPERFLPENIDKIMPQTFIPFGIGPRICIGMHFSVFEVKISLAKIIMQFKFKTTPKTDIPPKFRSARFFYQCKPLYAAVESRVHSF